MLISANRLDKIDRFKISEQINKYNINISNPNKIKYNIKPEDI